MKMKKIIALSLLAVSAVGVAACGKDDNGGGDTPTPDVTLKYEVTFNALGKAENPAKVVDVNALPTNLPTLANVEGFDFGGWSKKEDGSEKVNGGEEITANTTLYAIWIAATPQVKPTISFDLGGHGATIPTTEGNVMPELPSAYDSNWIFGGWYSDQAKTQFATAGGAVSKDTVLYADWIAKPEINKAVDSANVTTINNAEEFLAFRELTASEGEKVTGHYVLGADIDLGGIELPASKVEFAGLFDGNGHTIKNAVYNQAGAKTGILVAKLIDGGIIRNVKFLGCSVNSANESPGIVAGEVNPSTGKAAIVNVELNSCTVVTSSHYAGVVFGRSEASTGGEILLEGITMKNGCTSSCAQYGGLVAGDNTANVSLINSQIQGTFAKSSNNYGLLLGRTRSNVIARVQNVIVDVTSTAGGNSYALINQGKGNDKVIADNVVVLSGDSSFAGGTPKVYASNVFYKDSAQMAKANLAAAKVQATIDSAWYQTVLSDFANVWEVESNGGIKLKSASPNVPGKDDVLDELVLTLNKVQTRFIKGKDFDATGLMVMEKYNSGIQVISDKYTIDSSRFDKNAAGTYTITVKSTVNEAITKTYDVTVVEQTGISVSPEFAKRVFVVGDKVSITGLVVKGVWSDGKTEDLTSDLYNINTTGIPVDEAGNITTAGTYEISIECEGFEPQVYTVEVLASKAVAEEEAVTVTVDGQIQSLVDTDSMAFKTVQGALDYLTSSNLDGAVKKVINIKDGVYREKITVGLANVEFVGESREGTIITYDAVESTINPVSGKQYVLECATVHVNGEGFKAKNISIRNDFDYKNNQYNPEYADQKESSPQGLALTINNDKATLTNVHLYGNQDTLYLKKGRCYINGGLVEGNIDFIFGEANGIAYFNQTEIRAVAKALNAGDMKNNGYVTAMKGDKGNKADYGVVFNECQFTQDSDVPAGSMSLGRPWGPKATVAYVNCSFTDAYSKAAYDGKTKSRWYDMSGNSPIEADFQEYGSTGEGAISEAVAGGNYMTADKAANYTMENTFAIQNGTIAWATEFNPLDESAPSAVTKEWDLAHASSGNNTLPKGKYTSTYDLNGLLLDGTNGQITNRSKAENDSNDDTVMQPGAKFTLTVEANSSVLVEGYYAVHYTLNGVETKSNSFKQFYADTTTVEFVALETSYLTKVSVISNQTAPEAATVQSLVISGEPKQDLALGTEPDFSSLKVVANMSDGSMKTLTKEEYQLDSSAVKANEAGTYTVIVSYGGATATFDLNYVAVVDNRVTSSITVDYKGGSFNGIIAEDKDYLDGKIDATSSEYVNNKITYNGVKANSENNWLKYKAGDTITFEVADSCTIYVVSYNGATNYTVSTQTGPVEGTVQTPKPSNDSGLYTYQISEAGVITITFASDGYLGALGIEI